MSEPRTHLSDPGRQPVSPRSHTNPSLAGWDVGGQVEMPTVAYRGWRWLVRSWLIAQCRLRAIDRHHEPETGGVVYIANHQSFFDPPLMACPLRRPMHFMARDSLFHNPLFGRLIRHLNAFPVRRGTADLAAMKQAMRICKANGQVVIFAEGTRTRDGSIGPFLPGVAMLSQRAAEWTVPVLIDGAFEAWPRTRALPGLGQVTVRYGRPIHRDDARRQKPDQFVADVRQRLIDMQTELHRRRP
jgi:1-acyl-sn-glycerol-3-phosphate acyltransferase